MTAIGDQGSRSGDDVAVRPANECGGVCRREADVDRQVNAGVAAALTTSRLGVADRLAIRSDAALAADVAVVRAMNSPRGRSETARGVRRNRTTPAPAGVGVACAGLAVRASLAEGGGLADAIAQEVELRPADLAVPDDLDLLDPWAVDLERPLDPDATRDPPDGDRPGDPAAAKAHHDALEDLDPLPVALDDLRRDLHGVARRDLGKIRPELVTVEVNETILQKLDYDATQIKEGDNVEFVFYMGGGSR